MHTGRMSGHTTEKGVHYYVNNYHALPGCFPQTLRPIVYVFLNFDRNFANFVALSTDRSAKRLVRYKGRLVLNRLRKPFSNRYITGDAMLPQTGTKLTKKRGSEFGALLWRHLTPQRKTET